MAATSQPLSTQVALDILKAGGSATDAAIAANAMEGVVEPMMNGLGGDLMAIVYDPKSKRLRGINSSGRSRAAQGWCMLHDAFGKLPLSQILAPAIKYASEGFAVTDVIASEWEIQDNSSDINSNGVFPRAVDGFYKIFTNNGSAPKAGDIFQNPALAKTLSKIAENGCQEFYNGSIAEAIVNFSSIGGTHLTKQDLSSHHSEWVEPVNVTYRDRYRVFELPPNPQGIAALQMLNILEGFNLTEMGHNSADYLHVQIEAKKLAFADRAKYYADPDFVKIPVEQLISKEYATKRRKLIDMRRAAEEVDAGKPADHGSIFTGDTIYLTTADAEGSMVSLIQSNFEGFGSGLVVPELGFALQDRGALFSLKEDAANVYSPGKRPFHTIIPGFVFRDEEPWLSFGVMGGNMQPQGHAQILPNIIDFGMNVQEAGDAARYYHTGSSQPTGQIMVDGGEVGLEGGICLSVRNNLSQRGHHLYSAANTGGYQAIMLEKNGVYHGASEMRKDGQASGF
eukprot:UC4_evm7s1188